VVVLLYLVIVIAALVFAAGTAARAVWYARAPIHLRWELYPVPHEDPTRAAHGGSYFEQSEWWRSNRSFNLAGELRVMLPEMLFLNALREFNRPLWFRSFPFHFGLYLLAAACILALSAALATVAGRPPTEGLGRAAAWLGAATGGAGAVLAIGGALALLHRRLVDPALRAYTAPADVFNLSFFVVALGLLGAGYGWRADGTAGPVRILVGLLSWDASVRVSLLFAIGIVASASLAAYIPLTHMSHFVGKYFTYHAVRWDDGPTRDDRRTAAALARYLALKPTWSAPHLGADGVKSWAQIAASKPAEGGKR
jgi:nitrate reductase gamma subunit